MDKFSIFLVLLTVTVTLAVPTNFQEKSQDDQSPSQVLQRSRRDMSGIFDSIANGVGGLMEGFKSISNSIATAFNSIFSNDNKNKITDGFQKFQQGIKDAATSFSDQVSSGAKKIGDKIKNAFSSDKPKAGEPAGEVPTDETT